MNKENYELFINKILDAVKAYYGEDYEVTIRPVTKTNGVILQGLNIMEQRCGTCPTIYLEDFFEQYEKGVIFSDIFKQIRDTYEAHRYDEIIDINHFSNYEEVKKSLSIKLINYEMNIDLLDDVPYRLYEDLALVCIVKIPVDSDNMGSVLIHNNHICMWGVKQDKLFDDAIYNAFLNDKICIKKLTDTIMGAYTGNETESNNSDIFDICRQDPATLFVLSNEQLINGAAVITYPDVLRNIGEALACDFYIIPSSIHEVIILPDIISGVVSSINSMIRAVNKDVLDRQEILSEHAYMYSLSENKLMSILDVTEGQSAPV